MNYKVIKNEDKGIFMVQVAVDGDEDTFNRLDVAETQALLKNMQHLEDLKQARKIIDDKIIKVSQLINLCIES